jgi:hypothetical protein
LPSACTQLGIRASPGHEWASPVIVAAAFVTLR